MQQAWFVRSRSRLAHSAGWALVWLLSACSNGSVGSGADAGPDGGGGFGGGLLLGSSGSGGRPAIPAPRFELRNELNQLHYLKK